MDEARYRDVEQRLWASVGVEPVEHRVRLPHLGTEVRVLEIGAGPPVVFVHGGSASGANWAPLVAKLGGLRCLVVDRPGCGLSPPVAVDLRHFDRFEPYADALVPDIIEGLGLDVASVVATSLGGHFTLRGAAAHPERFTRVVEFGYVPGAPLAHIPMSMRLALIPGLQRLMTSIPPTPGAIRMIMRQLGMGAAVKDGRISQEMLDWFLSLLRETRTMRHETNLPRKLLQLRPKQPPLPPSVLAAVQCPLRFIWAEDDPLGGADVAKEFVAQFDDAELELWPEAGHAPWLADTDLAADRVADFLG